MKKIDRVVIDLNKDEKENTFEIVIDSNEKKKKMKNIDKVVSNLNQIDGYINDLIDKYKDDEDLVYKLNIISSRLNMQTIMLMLGECEDDLNSIKEEI